MSTSLFYDLVGAARFLAKHMECGLYLPDHSSTRPADNHQFPGLQAYKNWWPRDYVIAISSESEDIAKRNVLYVST